MEVITCFAKRSLQALMDKLKHLMVVVENGTASFKDFQNYFNGYFDGHLELLQGLHLLEKHVQNLWEKSNFAFTDTGEEAEELMEKIYTILPFDDSGTVWFGGIAPTKNKNDSNFSSIKSSFFNIYLVVAASSQDSTFITKLCKRIFYHMPTSISFCEAFIENDTRLISTLLAFLQIEKSHPALLLEYQFVNLFVALLMQFQENAANIFVDFLATEAVMIPFVLRSLKYLNGKLSLLKESYQNIMNSYHSKLSQNERILFKRSSNQPSSNIELSITGIDGTHRISIKKRAESTDIISTTQDKNFDIVKFFFDFYQLVLDAHKSNRFPFKSDALVKCVQNFISCINKV